MATELTIVEEIVLGVFNASRTAMKAADLGPIVLGQIFSAEEKSPAGMLQMLDNLGDQIVEAIYSLIAKNEIIEIEYSDAEIPDRVKSFLLPKATPGIRINGVNGFAAHKTDIGLEVDFNPD